jgi:outer membrane protein insertion porin family
LGEISIRERNLLGRGQDLRVSTTVSQRRQLLDFAFTEPYFLDRELSAGIDLFHVLRDNQDVASFDSTETGAGVRLGYDLNNDWSQRLRYRFSRESIENIDSGANQFIQAEEGEEFVSLLGQTVTYDKRNSIVDPTEGYLFAFDTDVAGLGGSVSFLRTSVRGTYYVPITEDMRIVTGAEAGTIVGLGDDVRISDRFQLGGDNLRGFAFAGAGPRDSISDDALGGERYATGSVEFVFPLGLPEEFGLSGALFTDVGYLTEVDDVGPSIQDEPSLRAAIGTGVNWQSPFGPIRVDFSQAILKEDFDETEVFRFNFGTRF